MFELLRIISDYIVYNLFALDPASNSAKCFYFFIYNTFKVYVLILIFGFIVGLAKGVITPEKTKQILSRAKPGTGNILAAVFAVITPVESFSAVPIFISFLAAGIPLSIAFTYLIVAPVTNEIAFALFWGLFGYKAAILYYGAGITVGLAGGIFIGALKPERYIESFVCSATLTSENERSSFKNLIIFAKDGSLLFFKSFWLYILIGVGTASIINGFVPQSFFVKYIGLHNPFVLPIAIIIVTFFYLNIVMAMPLILVLVSNGLPLGTVLAFTMAVTATSIPELFMLKRALKLPLLLIYFVVLIVLIILAGAFINFIS